MFMEYADKGDLASRLMPRSMSRDIKLDNMLLDNAGNVKLCDIGLVFLVQGPEIDLNKILTSLASD